MPRVVILGAGGHCAVLVDALLALGTPILGIVDGNPEKGDVLGVPIIGDDEWLCQQSVDEVIVVNGVGDIAARQKLFNEFSVKGYRFLSVLSPFAVISPYVTIGEGVQIMAGAVIQPRTLIRSNVIVNTGARVDHDCEIASHSHIAPGAVLCGGVTVGERSHIGAGATLIQNISVGDNSIVAAGAVVVCDVPPSTTVMGVPARSPRWSQSPSFCHRPTP